MSGIEDLRMRLAKPPVQQVNEDLPGIARPVASQVLPVYKGGVLTTPKPVKVFMPDITLAPGITILKAGDRLPQYCTGFRVVNQTGPAVVSVNGGGYRTVLNLDVFEDCEITQVEVNLSAGAITLQPWGTGE